MENTILIESEVFAKAAFDTLVEDEVITDSSKMHWGKIIDVDTRDCKTKEGTPFQMIDIAVKGSNGSLYSRSYSIDFMRKYLLQLGKKVEDILDTYIVFTIDKQYKKKISFLAFLAEHPEDDNGEVKYYIAKFENDIGNREDALKRLKALGL